MLVLCSQQYRGSLPTRQKTQDWILQQHPAIVDCSNEEDAFININTTQDFLNFEAQQNTINYE